MHCQTEKIGLALLKTLLILLKFQTRQVATDRKEVIPAINLNVNMLSHRAIKHVKQTTLLSGKCLKFTTTFLGLHLCHI